jgi:hypothetical protein
MEDLEQQLIKAKQGSRFKKSLLTVFSLYGWCCAPLDKICDMDK